MPTQRFLQNVYLHLKTHLCQQAYFMKMEPCWNVKHQTSWLLLEGLIPDKITRIQKADTLIFDGMAFVQSLLPHFEHLIFRNMAEMFFKHIFQIARNITDVKQFMYFLTDTAKAVWRCKQEMSVVIAQQKSIAYSWRFPIISFSGHKQG